MSKKEEKEEKVASGDGDLFSYIKARCQHFSHTSIYYIVFLLFKDNYEYVRFCT